MGCVVRAFLWRFVLWRWLMLELCRLPGALGECVCYRSGVAVALWALAVHEGRWDEAAEWQRDLAIYEGRVLPGPS